MRNHRIIALLGMWNLGFDPGSLEAAVKEARAALAAELPPGGDIVPRFCLARDALRRGEAKPESVVSGFLETCGGDDAPAPALAAAAVLALDAMSRALHEKYRDAFLRKHRENPEFYAFASFLRDRHHRYRLLKPNLSLQERRPREYIVGHGYPAQTNSLPEIELKKLDGSMLNLPKDTNGKLTLLLFVEPPAGATNDFPVVYRNGKRTNSDRIRLVMQFASEVTEKHINKEVNLVTAFLTDDASHVQSLMKTNAWNCQAAMVPAGLENPLVHRLGIFSADRVPNIFLLRRDGTVAWRASGFDYKTEFGFPFAFLLGMKVHIEVCEMETAYSALERGDFKEAARVFAGPYLPWDPDRFGWRAPRYHGKALAYMGLNDWEGALESIDTAIGAQKLRHFSGRRRKWAVHWRLDAATVTVDKPDDIIIELWAIKAVILDKLGRKEEAAGMRKRSEESVEPGFQSVYWLFHERLKNWRLNRKP